ncbi:hypothetical protein [Chryseobacterium daeguense]|uniref:hypothetical protein n=1 Tax=Chryseobacterium daeguense TaxID=412438 RepID=UPI0003FD40C3|nr:hypothetical protein [Chryseobacterium daeguense]
MKFFNELLHNCEETSLNIVKSEETSLSPSAWLKMQFHIAFCKCCRNFKKQTKIVDKVLYNHFNNVDVSQKAPQDLKDKIKLNLKK